MMRRTTAIKGELDPLLRPLEVADWIGMSKNWLDIRRMRGTGPPFIRVGNGVRYRRSDVERWLAENQQTFSQRRSNQPEDIGSEVIAQILTTYVWNGRESPFDVRITDAEGTRTGARYHATDRGTFRLDKQPVGDLPLRSPTGRLVFPLQIAVTDGRGRTSTYTVKGEPRPKELIQ